MATCPKGHDSGTLDYCDVCGAPMAVAGGAPPGVGSAGAPAALPPLAETAGGAAVTGPSGAGAAGAGTTAGSAGSPASPVGSRPCPVCGTPQSGRFCEEDGYDLLLAPPVPAVSPAVPSAGSTAAPAAAPAAASAGRQPVSPAPASSPAPEWHVTVHTDIGYFEAVRAMGGEDAGSLAFPSFAPERRFELTGEQVVVGRRSRSRGVNPDIDLVGPPEDPGVSHVHAVLIAQDAGWAAVDVGSANGTYVNDFGSIPIAQNTPVPLKDGDTVYLGAWTALTIHGGARSAHRE